MKRRRSSGDGRRRKPKKKKRLSTEKKKFDIKHKTKNTVCNNPINSVTDEQESAQQSTQPSAKILIASGENNTLVTQNKKKRQTVRETTITDREKIVLKRFVELKTGLPTKQETITLSAQFGRWYNTTKRWLHDALCANNNQPMEVETPTFSMVQTMHRTSGTYKFGCGKSCQKNNNNAIHDTICPSCKQFIWHRPCLERRLKLFGYENPDYSTKWQCLHCLVRQNNVTVV